MDYVLGIDIGGTSIKGAIVNKEGKVLTDAFSFPIIKKENQVDTINRLCSTVKSYLKDNSEYVIEGIGIGIPGSLDTEKGVVIFSNNLCWENLPIVDIFKKHFSLPIRITNDANAAALGENRFGAGKEYQDMIMITLGTGVGGGIIDNHKLIEGYQGKGAELGHTVIRMNGRKCSCGRKGCLEQYASATALIRMTKEMMLKDKSSLLWSMDKIDGKSAFIAARKKDKLAIKIVDKYVSYLGEGLLNFCNIFRPECIVLSGGIAKEGDYLIDKLDAYLAKQEYGYPRSPKTVIKVAELGYNSGIIGAASLLL